MPQYIDGNPAQKVNILLTIDVPDIRTITMIEDNLIAVEHRQVALLVFRKYFLICLVHIQSYSYSSWPISGQLVCQYPVR